MLLLKTLTVGPYVVLETGCTVIDSKLTDTIVTANARIRDHLYRSPVGERTTVQRRRRQHQHQ